VGGCTTCQERLLQLAGPLQAAVLQRLRAESAAPGPVEASAGFLDRLKQAGPPAASGAATEPVPIIPGVQIIEELGRGGTGIVYKARQVGLNRLVAVKVLRPEKLASAEARIRARRGAEAIARFQHPNIVQIYQVGIQDGYLYGVLEYLDGGTLKERIAAGPVTPRQAAEIVRTVAATVQALHDRGIVHRDLKPANILLTKDGVAKIADFGLAKLIEGTDACTQSGVAVGTPSYMAPEQAAARAADVGPPADVYALGAILYELLTGQPPFQGHNPHDTLDQVLSRSPPPPSALRRDTPAALEAICLQCLHKDPGRRPARAHDVAERLSDFLDAGSTRALVVTATRRSLQAVAERPVATLSVLLATVAVAAALLALYQAWDAEAYRRGLIEQAHDQAATALEEAEQALYLTRLQLAQHELERNNLAAARAVLEQCLPAPGRPDRRDPTWLELWQKCQPGDR
jgi:serine/threonine-protein kinase